ncbi:MAG: heparinase II/III family protein [Kiritimatiellae bacterium]|nr:heparinase II/III family protein [Kiritimatiellia bacterium]
MNKLLLVLRTVRYLKPVQVVNRLWRKRPHGAVSHAACPVRRAGALRVSWPTYFTCWDGHQTFTFLNETHGCSSAEDWNAGDRKKLWLYNLHYFDCLRTPAALDGMDARRRAVALMQRWIEENPEGVGNGWEPYPISLRVVNWIKWLLREEPGAEEFSAEQRAVLELSLAVQVRRLVQQLEYHLLANHLLANAKALVFAGLFFTGDEAAGWLKKGLALYRTQLPEQVLDDGVHFELSAMYHSIMLEDLLDCINLSESSGCGEAEFLREFASRMLGALNLLTGPDGAIVKFNDAAEGIALTPACLMDYAAQLGVSSKVVTELSPWVSGFVRLVVGDWTLLAKCGEIGPSYQPGHAHADSLSFELWRGHKKIITDTGTDRYVVDAERKRQRGSAAHNVVVIDGRNSSEVWGGHRVARRAKSLGWTVEDVGDAKVLTARIRDVKGITWTRTLRLTAEGLQGEDRLEGLLKQVKTIDVRFHCPASIQSRVIITAEVGDRASPPTLQPVWEPCNLAVGFGRCESGTTASVLVPVHAETASPVVVRWHIQGEIG